MRISISIPESLRSYYRAELELYKQAFSNREISKAWRHLERAHILGQAYPKQHTYVHWEMLRFGFKIKNVKEIIGQLPRLAFGGIKSFVGIVPTGNTGGANVPILKPMPIPQDLQQLLDKAQQEKN